MSSILDALERAEKERNQIDKKPFMERAEPHAGLLQRRSLWVFAGMLLLVNLLIWFWVVMGPEQASEPPLGNNVQTEQNRQAEPMATADTVVSMLEQPRSGKERKSDPPLVVEALVPKKVVVTKPPESAVTPSVATPPKSVPVKTMVQPPPVVEQVEATAEPEPAQAAVSEPAKSSTIASDNRLAKLSASEVTRKQEIATAPPEAEPDEAEQVPMLWELPANVQEKLSGLTINILVYDEDKARRFVIINMRKYREGDRLVPSGMQLERITRKGVVIDYGEGLVKL
jgi:hypothetical protein